MIGFFYQEGVFRRLGQSLPAGRPEWVFLVILLLFFVVPVALGAPTWLIIVLVAITIVALPCGMRQ